MNKKQLAAIVIIGAAALAASQLKPISHAVINAALRASGNAASFELSDISSQSLSVALLQFEQMPELLIEEAKLSYFPLTLSHASVQFMGGRIKADNVELLPADKNYKTQLQVEAVPLGQLLPALTGGKATATGTMSGTLPLSYALGGVPSISSGKLFAAKPGNIQMQPDAIAGDNEQIALVRQVMSNLHYETLEVDLNTDAKGKLTAQLRVHGSNPDVASGQLVKLNVNLSGDVLELMEQTLLIADPHKILERQQHEQN